MLHVSAGAHENTECADFGYLWPDAYLADLAEAIKKIVNIPFVRWGNWATR